MKQEQEEQYFLKKCEQCELRNIKYSKETRFSKEGTASHLKKMI